MKMAAAKEANDRLLVAGTIDINTIESVGMTSVNSIGQIAAKGRLDRSLIYISTVQALLLRSRFAQTM